MTVMHVVTDGKNTRTPVIGKGQWRYPGILEPGLGYWVFPRMVTDLERICVHPPESVVVDKAGAIILSEIAGVWKFLVTHKYRSKRAQTTQGLIPGGSRENLETPLEVMQRELIEELLVRKWSNNLAHRQRYYDLKMKEMQLFHMSYPPVYLGRIQGQAAGQKKGNIVQITLFLTRLPEEPKESSEIAKLQWVEVTDTANRSVSELVRTIAMPALQKHWRKICLFYDAWPDALPVCASEGEEAAVLESVI